MAAVPPFFVEVACMARSNRVLSEAGGKARWRFKRCAIERERGESAAAATGRAIVSGASSMLDMLRRSRRPPLVARGASVGLGAAVASGPSKSARDERQLLRGRPPTSPPSPNKPPSIPYRQRPPPQRWIPRAERFEGWTERTFGRV